MSSNAHPKIQVESKNDVTFLKKEMLRYIDSSIKNGSVEPCEELQEKLEKWVGMIFEMASDSIEVNGMPYNVAFDQQVEYEPINEELRNQTDELQHQIQETMVQISSQRKIMPKQLNQLNAETLQIVTKSTEEAAIEENESESSEMPPVVAKPVSIENYDLLCKQQANLSKELPETLKKAKEIEALLNDLDIPDLSKEHTEKDLSSQKRRRSSLSRALCTSHFQNAQNTYSPRKAAEGLMKRLEMESRKRVVN